MAGIEADFGWANETANLHGSAYPTNLVFGSPSFPFGATPEDIFRVTTAWDGSAVLRVGRLLTPSTLLYVSGGLAWPTFKLHRPVCDHANLHRLPFCGEHPAECLFSVADDAASFRDRYRIPVRIIDFPSVSLAIFAASAHREGPRCVDSLMKQVRKSYRPALPRTLMQLCHEKRRNSSDSMAMFAAIRWDKGHDRLRGKMIYWSKKKWTCPQTFLHQCCRATYLSYDWRRGLYPCRHIARSQRC